MDLIINREYLEEGTNGELWCGSQLVCHTIELPYRGNQRNLSCIPEGFYFLGLRRSQRFGLHLHIRNVSHREYVLIHPANNAIKELRGCIAPVETITGDGRGANSRKALAKLLKLVSPIFKTKEKLTLTINKKNDESER